MESVMKASYRSAAIDANASSSMGGLNYVLQEALYVTRINYYLIGPGESTFEKIEEVPNFFMKVVPVIPLMILLEVISLYIQGKKSPRFAETMCSLLCVVLMFLPGIVVGQIEVAMYIWLYDNYNIIDLSWNSPVTWFLCLLAQDFGQYLWHIAAHQINFIWAFHQVHHSSQDFNMSIGVRLPTFNRYVAILFNLPMAFFFPPSIFYVHYQLNYVFQIWIHSNSFPKMGWLDYVINNPSLHRVHHGRNRYCIDKNYAAVFMFWDVLFGTLEREKDDEEIYYGLVSPVNSFDPIYIQFHHMKCLAERCYELPGIGNKLSVFLKGPGWGPGKPRLGYIEEVPVIPEDKTLHSTPMPLWLKFYVLLQIPLIYFFFSRALVTKVMFPLDLTILHTLFIALSIASMGCLLEVRRVGPLLEGLRCILYFPLEMLVRDALASNILILYFLRTVFFTSAIFWVSHLRIFSKDALNKKKVN